ncbi:MAG: hypothetical protein HY046_06045 [Acidobacteria bacterium]|nr:hypothetical protein [Acidobacteriota bacterium]
MNRKLLCGAAALVVLGTSAIVLGQMQKPQSQAGKNASFDKMKSLVGEWKGTNKGKEKATAVYRLVSNGSALEETLTSPDNETMVTIYYVDRDRLMMTHYCAIGNQPRMAASPSKDAKEIAFNFVDASNLANPQLGHMRAMALAFVDANHMTQHWTWRENGKDGAPEEFQFARRR